MKFNTLTFDANLPTTQQVNVPTNTDYKVGMKVKRNGEVQQLGPDEITIYTGEITPGATTVVDPADSPSNLERTVNGTNKTTIFMMFPKASLSAYTDKYIAPSDIEQTWHLSGETTSTPLEYGDLEIGYGVQYVEGTAVWYSYKGKWCRIASGEIAERKDRVQIKDTALMRQNFNLGVDAAAVFFNGTIPTAEAPILVDSTITFHDEDVPVTIPTDADKTNGYVTFTQAAGDDASFRQLKVAVEHGYDFNDYTERYTGQFPATAPDPNPSIVKIKASDLGLTGHTLKAEDYKNVHRYYWRKNQPVPADLSAWSYMEYIWPRTAPLPPEQPWPQFKLTQWNGRDVYIGCPAEDTTFNNETDDPNIKGRTAKKGIYYFFITNEAGTKFVDFTPEHTFEVDDYVIVTSALKFSANYYYGTCFKMTFGTPFSADFKLNVNEFKSQCGDLNAQTDPDFNTAKVEGTYADGTEFSFDFCIQ